MMGHSVPKAKRAPVGAKSIPSTGIFGAFLVKTLGTRGGGQAGVDKIQTFDEKSFWMLPWDAQSASYIKIQILESEIYSPALSQNPADQLWWQKDQIFKNFSDFWGKKLDLWIIRISWGSSFWLLIEFCAAKVIQNLVIMHRSIEMLARFHSYIAIFYRN